MYIHNLQRDSDGAHHGDCLNTKGGSLLESKFL